LGGKPTVVHKDGVTSLILWVGDEEDPISEKEEEYKPLPPVLPEFVPKALKWYDEIYLEDYLSSGKLLFAICSFLRGAAGFDPQRKNFVLGI
jgi:hypothetical protein